MNKSIIGSIALMSIMVFSACTPQVQKESPTPTPAPAVRSNLPAAEVTLSKTGFVPRTISVQKGQSVKWTNSDTLPHRIAVDPHPTHTGLEGFDSEESITPKGTYTFTFEKAGTYTYHDETNPGKIQGTVIVE